MKMNNKNNNSAVNAGPKGTLSKEMKEFAGGYALQCWDEHDFEYLFKMKWEDRPKELDDEIARIIKEYKLIDLQLLLEDIGLAHAEQDAFEECFDYDEWWASQAAWEDEYLEICIELDFEEEEVKYIAECTPSIDILVTAREQDK